MATAYRVGSMMRRTYPLWRPGAMKLVAKARRNIRQKARLRKRVGERIGTGPAKRHETNVDDTLTTRELRSDPLLNIPAGTALNQRQRDIVNFRGIKVCMSLVLNSGLNTGNGEHVYVNVAVISPKADNLTGDDAVPTAEFFRGNADDRAQDFDSTQLSSLEFRCLPINTDKYNVHKHIRFMLGPYASTEGKNTKTLEFYVKVNRQIRYEATNANPEGKAMYLCYWACFQDDAAGTGQATGQINHQLRLVRYFREPKN